MRTHLRPAFTLIELIVVIGIIALLATLSAAAVMRVQESQREGNTNKTLRALQMGLDPQVKAVVDRAAGERPHEIIVQMTSKGQPTCGADLARAKALHLKLKLRQEFPQTFAEVRYVFSGQYQNPCTGQVLDLSQLNAQYGHLPNDIYRIAIGNANGTPPEEAAVLLPIVLAKSRGGAAFNALEAGPTNTINLNGREFKVLVDSWDKPIYFRRWAVDVEMAAVNNMLADELNSEPFVSKSAVQTGFRDPADPGGKLPVKVWSGTNELPGARAIAKSWFIVPLGGAIADPFDGFNRGPFVASSGKDKNPSTADDLFSFRLQGTGRGN